jgi:hypothetical protein
MSQHFLREIETLKKKMLAVGAAVEERISQAITAVVKRDAALAQPVTEAMMKSMKWRSRSRRIA